MIKISIIKSKASPLDSIFIYNTNQIKEKRMNPFAMMKDAKNMEKMMKPALEKFMKESGFIKHDELEPLKRRIAELESEITKIKG